MSIMIHLDQLKVKRHVLSFNTGHIPDFTKLKNLEIIRED